MLRKVAGIVLLVLILGGVIVYIALGGLKQPVISRKTSAGYTIAGVIYKGSAADEKLAALFNQVKQYHREGTLAGTLTAVYYDTLGADKGRVKCLVGVIVTDTSAVLPAGFSLQNIRMKEVVQAQVNAHFLVAPAPEKIQARLTKYAIDSGLQLENLLIEKYLDERNFILEIPVKTNNL